jgi:hypothetical protein
VDGDDGDDGDDLAVEDFRGKMGYLCGRDFNDVFSSHVNLVNLVNLRLNLILGSRTFFCNANNVLFFRCLDGVLGTTRF